jgi:FkbM family methyltransferase
VPSAAQLLTDRLTRPGGEPTRRVSWLARRALLALTDPPVSLDVAGQRIRLPLSHDLPAIRGALPDYASNVGRAAAAAAAKGHPVIDVGANVGDTVAIVRAEVPPARILAIEGAREHLAFLRENVSGLEGVEVAAAYLGDKNQILEAKREVRRGSGRLVPGDADAQQVEVVTLDRLLEAHPAFGAAAFLKVDTDGFDARVLRGATGLLANARPVVFFELHPRLMAQSDPEGVGILTFMSELGYHDMVVYTERGELLAALRADGPRTGDDLIAYASRDARRYWDVCIFHADDAELASRFAADERAYAEARRA